MIAIMEGDQYGICITLYDDNETLITEDLVEEVEVCIGKYIKYYSTGDVTFSEGAWVFPLSQEESFGFVTTSVDCQIRVKFVGGDVIGEAFDRIEIKRSRSRRIL